TCVMYFFFFFQAEDGIRDRNVTGVQTCALPIYWQIESLHWLLDVVFREDANKTLNKHLAFNLNVMDKFCLAVLKRLDFGKKMSLRRKKYALSLSFDQYLKKII